MVILAVIAVLVLGGGVSVVAENAAPGDALYAVKTSVNEEVRGLLAIGAEADALWEVELAERRLKEAKTLEVRGTLTTEAAADLNAEFNSHAEAALEAASTMQAEGKGEAAQGLTVALEAVTSAHADLFAREAGSGQATGKRVFVLPHVLEKSGVRAASGDVTGDASAKQQAADLDMDGALDVVVGAEGSSDARVNKVDALTIKQSAATDPDSDGDGVSDAEASLKVEAGTGIKPSYDLGTQKKI